jgi:hypothetical protein
MDADHCHDTGQDTEREQKANRPGICLQHGSLSSLNLQGLKKSLKKKKKKEQVTEGLASATRNRNRVEHPR